MYRETKKRHYGNSRNSFGKNVIGHKPPTYGASTRIRKETSWHAELHKGLVKTEDMKITPCPVEYVSENEKSGGVKAGFKLANAEVAGATKNNTKVKFPEELQKKPKGVDVV